MKLAEALVERGDLQKRLQEISNRIGQNVMVEEGREPEEKVQDLINEAAAIAEKLTLLVIAINKTNSVSVIEQAPYTGSTVMELLAKRDELAQRRNLYNVVLNHNVDPRYNAYSRSKDDVRFESTVNAKEIREEMDKLAKERRMVDTFIQSVNWTLDIVE